MGGEQRQDVQKKPVATTGWLNFDQKFKYVICYNCGEPCHYVGMCQKQKKCFMCGSVGQHMDKCQEWYKEMSLAQFYGSASSGLGFFHVDVEEPVAKWLNLDNVGIAVVEGEISIVELKQNFSDIWKTNWPWQMRELEQGKILVRFPPSKKIQDLVGYPSINLKKKGVSVSFVKWDGDLPSLSEMPMVWLASLVSLPSICPGKLSLGLLQLWVCWKMWIGMLYSGASTVRSKLMLLLLGQ